MRSLLMVVCVAVSGFALGERQGKKSASMSLEPPGGYAEAVGQNHFVSFWCYPKEDIRIPPKRWNYLAVSDGTVYLGDLDSSAVAVAGGTLGWTRLWLESATPAQVRYLQFAKTPITELRKRHSSHATTGNEVGEMRQ